MTDELYRFSTALEVRWRDVNALGHVNNAVYFNYLEQVRLHYMRELGFLLPNSTDVGVIIAEAGCRFKSPVTAPTAKARGLLRISTDALQPQRKNVQGSVVVSV